MWTLGTCLPETWFRRPTQAASDPGIFLDLGFLCRSLFQHLNFIDTLAGSWIGNGAARTPTNTPICNASIAGSSLTHCATTPVAALFHHQRFSASPLPSHADQMAVAAQANEELPCSSVPCSCGPEQVSSTAGEAVGVLWTQGCSLSLCVAGQCGGKEEDPEPCSSRGHMTPGHGRLLGFPRTSAVLSCCSLV